MLLLNGLCDPTHSHNWQYRKKIEGVFFGGDEGMGHDNLDTQKIIPVFVKPCTGGWFSDTCNHFRGNVCLYCFL